MNVLALSTSTPRGSAAVVRDDGGVVEATYVDLQGHAERLFEAIDSALARAGLTRDDLDAVACDVGPGSFTGVRVGVSSAKGIALALGLPLAGVVSLEAMAAAALAEGAAQPGDVVVAALDAKKGEVFLAAYAGGATLLPPSTRPLAPEAFALGAETFARVEEGAAPVHAAESAAPARLPAVGGAARVVVVGEVAAGLVLPPGVRLARGPALDFPDAAWIGRLALPRLAAGAPLDPADLEPLYVRAPDAVPMAPV